MTTREIAFSFEAVGLILLVAGVLATGIQRNRETDTAARARLARSYYGLLGMTAAFVLVALVTLNV